MIQLKNDLGSGHDCDLKGKKDLIIRQIFCSTGRPVEFYQTSSRTILLDVQQTYFSATSVAAEAHALAHTVYWTSSRGYFSATGRPVEKNSTGRPVEWFYWTSSRTDDLGHCKCKRAHVCTKH